MRMCGLAGMMTASHAPRVRWEFERLLRASEIRGVDATGVLAIQQNGTHHLIKTPGAARKFLKRNDWNGFWKNTKHAPSIVIGHTRHGTQGDPQIAANNHPIQVGRVIGAHNGIISNDEELRDLAQDRYQLTGRGTVDSEAPLLVLAGHLGRDAIMTPEILRMIWESVAGWFTYTLIDEKDPTTVWFINGDGGNLVIGSHHASQTIYWASTPEILKQAEIDEYIVVPNGVIFRIGLSTLGWLTLAGNLKRIRCFQFTPAFDEIAAWEDEGYGDAAWYAASEEEERRLRGRFTQKISYRS